jgi:hypothetical protein
MQLGEQTGSPDFLYRAYAALCERTDSLRASAENIAPGLDPAARSAFI